MTKRVDKRIDKVVLRWVGHMERMENERIAKGLCRGSVLVDAQWVGRGRGGLIP